ncbi:MAG: ATP-binding protein [Planctomycetaceae bacterium]
MSSITARTVSSVDKSLFFQRLKSLEKSNPRLRNLCTATQTLLESASAISQQVVRFLPQFTLHDQIHLWNVLSFMEHLAGGEKEINKLGAGDCAMAIWAAFTHDLGMVLAAEELAALDTADHVDTVVNDTAQPGDKNEPTKAAVEAWRAYRDGHEHWRAIAADPKSDSSRMKLGVIRASYIRDSHARFDPHSGHCRIDDWLQCLAEEDRLIAQALEDFAIADHLVRVAVSHNQHIDWLPDQLKRLGIESPHADNAGPELGAIHWTWIGWLLRLADVFDCDKSRTPRILFEHSGVTDTRSQTEWQKHLAIPAPPEWNAGNSGQSLVYTSQRCPSPVVEKALHQIVGWMNDEINKVRAAQNAALRGVDSLPTLRLPLQAEVTIRNRVGGYMYHDMEFRLDRDAVVELLMGESLYGGPELALRELVQNALDAVHLRDQRNELAKRLNQSRSTEQPRQPHEPWVGEDPEVRVTWGEEDGKKFVRVEDNGVGMTVGTMKRYLTQIGRSYYKSNDFRAEQELMREHGILCTAISQFGIGFLSVFMLADNVTIHTRPVAASPNPPATNTPEHEQESARFPFRAEIHGPHGLLAFYPDNTRRTPGTTVTLWLKDSFVLPEWDRELLLAQLRKEFYDIEVPDEAEQRREELLKSLAAPLRPLDPAFEIGRFIVWPLYPVKLNPESEDSVVLDDWFHWRELVPLDREKLAAKAKEWDHDIPEIATTDWQACDWRDEEVVDGKVSGTGSRIRLVGPQPSGLNQKIATPEEWGNADEYLPSGQPTLLLGSFTEPQLPEPKHRYQCLVNGVRVVPGFQFSKLARDCKLLPVLRQLPLWPGVGGWVWIDLRDEAMPRLRADRSAPITSQLDVKGVSKLHTRWMAGLPPILGSWSSLLVNFPNLRRPRTLGLLSDRSSRLGLPGISAELLSELLASESGVLRSLYASVPGNERFLSARDADLTYPRALSRDLIRERAMSFARNRARDLASDFIGVLSEKLAYAVTRDIVRKGARIRARELSRHLPLRRLALTHFASESLWPSLRQCHPGLGLTGGDTTLGQINLLGPIHIKAASNALPVWIAAYDLCAPFTGISLPRLSTHCPTWRANRGWRRLLLLPFLYGETPGNNWGPRFRMQSELRMIDRLLLFMPNPEHEEWLFDEHTRDEWNAGSASALWDLHTDEVLYAHGIHTEESMRQVGKPLMEWLGIDD